MDRSSELLVFISFLERSPFQSRRRLLATQMLIRHKYLPIGCRETRPAALHAVCVQAFPKASLLLGTNWVRAAEDESLRMKDTSTGSWSGFTVQPFEIKNTCSGHFGLIMAILSFHPFSFCVCVCAALLREWRGQHAGGRTAGLLH